MMVALDTDISHMHLTLSSYLAGFALFHLACGPLADRFGRKPVLTGGTVLFVAPAWAAVMSTTVGGDAVVSFSAGNRRLRGAYPGPSRRPGCVRTHSARPVRCH